MDNHTRFKVKAGAGIAGLLVIIFLGINSVSYVPLQHYGIVFNRFGGGYEEKVEEPGFTFHLPFAQKVYDVESNAHTLPLTGENSINVQTHDGQKLTTEVDVQYKVPKENAVEVFKYYQNKERDIRENMQYKLKPVVQRSIEAITTQYDVSEILGEKRKEVEDAIREDLKQEMANYNLELTSFKLVSTDAEDGIEQAINAEAVAQQEVETARQQQEKRKIENETKRQQVESEAEQEKIRAEGQAEANRILSDSLTREIIDYGIMEARQKHGWIEVQGIGEAIVDTTE